MHPLLSYAFIRPLRVLSGQNGHVFLSLNEKRSPPTCNPTPPHPSLPLRPPQSSLPGLKQPSSESPTYCTQNKEKGGERIYICRFVLGEKCQISPTSLPPCVAKHRVFALHNTVHKIKKCSLTFCTDKAYDAG
jgi:hypothetical protein